MQLDNKEGLLLCSLHPYLRFSYPFRPRPESATFLFATMVDGGVHPHITEIGVGDGVVLWVLNHIAADDVDILDGVQRGERRNKCAKRLDALIINQLLGIAVVGRKAL